VVTSHRLSVALQGLRDTVTATLFRTQSRSVDTLGIDVGDLSSSSLVRQSGITLDIGHRLTPESSLSLSGSVQRTSGSLASQGNRLTSLTMVYGARFDTRISGSLSLRHVQSSSETSPYTENALIGTISYSF
jgi:uncharacterized protein (PEP-CTERM system associated)